MTFAYFVYLAYCVMPLPLSGPDAKGLPVESRPSRISVPTASTASHAAAPAEAGASSQEKTTRHRRRCPRWAFSGETLAEGFSSQKNAIGLLRLLMAVAVVVSHSSPLGYGKPDPGDISTGGQINLGRLAVFGFFILSGFLISRSAMHQSIGRYTWARALRIAPGLWVCLIFTACVVAPLLYYHQMHTTAGFWHAGNGPFSYMKANWWTGLGQFDISNVIATARKWHHAFDIGFDGALWSLPYEIACYFIVGVLAVTKVLKSSRRLILFIAVGLWIYLLDDLDVAASWRAPQDLDGGFTIGLPVVQGYMGPLQSTQFAYLGFAFTLGMLLQLYADRVPVNRVLAAAAAALFVGTMWVGAFYVVGIPAFAYLLFWLALKLPRPFPVLWHDNDFSYGIYIYGFVVEQALAVMAFNRHGQLAYLMASLVGTLALAVPSWFLVEKQAMKLKRWKLK
ncbi:acyltransferase family protein [Catenulispora rubra]|uniref:acyltransferase family protein n=1 Tax=Catenulispora rubra TaxID=280293 RepID=UPI00189267D0|nr:acyltransferase [Catenulispora rubra]